MDFLIQWSLFLLASIILGFFLEKRTEKEQYLYLKFVFYACLGAVSFPVYDIQLPLGIILFLIVLHPKKNSRYKRYMALFGFLFFLLQLILGPFDTFTLREETQQMGQVTITDESFDTLMTHIDRRIGDDSLRLEQSQLLFDQGGNLRNATFELIAKSPKRFIRYEVTYQEVTGTLTYRPREEVLTRSLESYYQKLIDASTSFRTLKTLSIKQILHESKTPYVEMDLDGLYETFSLQDATVLLINDQGELIPYVNTGEDVLANAIRLTYLRSDGQSLREKTILLYNYSFETSRRKGVVR
ncbi:MULTISPECIES: hypothetical protein [unclassified Exiguobacterium]|uniref:hypothetical protein n=1 Tax=Exiguobacterium TaxID=33986 RepID=UPI000DF80FE4|nr:MULTISPECIES: hypothetical protein [unclassified Exiguobacterium]MCK2157882.1 hypothetical protein [Exiguobacterium sp. 17-1]RDB34669.1 hypothetical protein DVG79_08320 [Exiguobacterium sp. RIT594]